MKLYKAKNPGLSGDASLPMEGWPRLVNIKVPWLGTRTRLLNLKKEPYREGWTQVEEL